MGDDVVTGGEKAEPVGAEPEQQTKNAGNGASQAPAQAGIEPDSPEALENAQREARERLASIAAAMAERSKQPIRKSDSIGGTLTLAEIEAMERPPTPAEERPDPASIVPPPDSPTVPVERSERKSEATITSTQTHIVPKQPKPAKPIDKKLIGIISALCVVSGIVGLWIGSKFRTEHTVIYGLAPAKDSGFGQGKPLTLKANGDNPVADIVAEVMPTVVNIDIAPPTPAGGSDAAASSSPFSFNSGGNRRFDPGSPERTLGSGVIIRSDGYVVTSAHVIRAMGNRIVITLSDKRSFDAKVVGRDSFTDLALLKIDADNLPVARFGTSANLRPGDWAIAVGSPLCYDHTVTLGIISAVGRSLSELNSHVDLIQTDAAINQGNSGGPLLNNRGEVVGIIDAVRGGAQNISFAVPVDVVRNIADELMAHGSIKRPYLGIFMDDLNPYMAQRMNVTVTHGVVITRVVAGSPCEKAGVGEGDIVVSVDGRKVETTKEVRDILKDVTPGEVMEFVFLRKGSEEKRKVVVGNYPED